MKLHIVDIFDFKLFSKLMFYVKPYKNIYYFVMIAAILVSAFSTLTPYLLKIIIDESLFLNNLNNPNEIKEINIKKFINPNL